MPDVDYTLPIGERKVINESLYLEPFKQTVKLLLAIEEDEPVLLRYVADQFSQHGSISVAAGISSGDLAVRYKSMVQRSLKESLTIVATDCFQLCGVVIANRVKVGPKRTEPFKKDYEAEIAASKAHCLAARKIEVFVNAVNSFTPNYLPEECGEFYRIDLFSVLPSFQGAGLGKQLWTEALRLGHNRGFKFAESSCSALVSTQIAQKAGMNVIFAFQFSDFRANGQPVFDTALKDGAINLLIGQLDKIVTNLGERKRQLIKDYKLPEIDRELVEEFMKRDATIRIEVAKPEDEPTIVHFRGQEFIKQDPFLRTLQTSKKDQTKLEEFFGQDRGANGHSLIASENGILCGFAQLSIMKMEGGIVAESAEHLFARLDAKSNRCIMTSILYSFICWLHTHVAQRLPPGKHEVFYIDILSVHPDCRGINIGQTLWNRCMRRAYDKGFKYAHSTCTAQASTKIALNAGMEIIYSFPVEKIRYKNEQIFSKGRLYEGSTAANVMFADLEKLFGEK